MARKKSASSSLFSKDEELLYSDPTKVSSSEPIIDASGLQQASQPIKEDFSARIGGSSRQTVIDTSSVTEMAQRTTAEQKRFYMDERLRRVFMFLIAFVVIYCTSLILPDHLVEAVFNANAPTFSEVVQSRFEHLAQLFSGNSPTGFEYSPVVIMLLIALIGAGLSAIGASYQVSFRNQLATPSSLGVMSGAALGSSVYFVVCQDKAQLIADRIAVTQEQVDALATGTQANPFITYFSFMQGALYSIAGAFIVVALTVIIAKIAGHGKLNNAVLIIAGQVFASVSSALIVLFRLYLETTRGQDAVSGLAMAQIGDFSGIGRTLDLLFLGGPIIVALVLLFFLAPSMNAIANSGDEAQTLGLRVNIVRGLIIFFSTIITAVIVAFVGSIGFVGFAIPQIVRRFVGPDFRFLLPASALAGASFLLIVNFTYTSFTFSSTGIGVVTSLLGSVVFIISVIRQRKVASYEG